VDDRRAILLDGLIEDCTSDDPPDRPFRAGSPQLDHAITKLNTQINTELPAIIADYLTTCRETGVPRNHGQSR
jgi:hypothetical protein